MEAKKTALLIIDPQNDFCNIEGALFIPDARADMKRLAHFISENSRDIDKIVFTLDSHQVYDISHPSFWQDSKGNAPEPFTSISLDDLKTSKWEARYEPDKAQEYIQKLEETGEYMHTVWPEHCIVGTWGASLEIGIENALRAWAQNGKTFLPIYKGLNPYTEHFGALRANVPDGGDPGSLLNLDLLAELEKYETIFIAGEAKSHCVGNTVKQLIASSQLICRCVFLSDCMSDVVGFEGFADEVFKQAIAEGAGFADSNFKI